MLNNEVFYNAKAVQRVAVWVNLRKKKTLWYKT